MEVPDHHTPSRNFSIDKPTALPILCRAIRPITTQAALAKAGLGEQDGVWVRDMSHTFNCVATVLAMLLALRLQPLKNSVSMETPFVCVQEKPVFYLVTCQIYSICLDLYYVVMDTS